MIIEPELYQSGNGRGLSILLEGKGGEARDVLSTWSQFKVQNHGGQIPSSMANVSQVFVQQEYRELKDLQVWTNLDATFGGIRIGNLNVDLIS